jgi:hypothetical protein
VTGAARRVGLSTPAMSHALARIRERLGDPILVRAGRGMVLTPRARGAEGAGPRGGGEAAPDLSRSAPFRAARAEPHLRGPRHGLRAHRARAGRWTAAPRGGARCALRFVPNGADDATQLRERGSDLAVGIYGDLPPEMRSRHAAHRSLRVRGAPRSPGRGQALSLEQFLRLAAPAGGAPRQAPAATSMTCSASAGLHAHRGPGGAVLSRRCSSPPQTDYVLTISERVARQLGAAALACAVLEVPLPLRPYALSLGVAPALRRRRGHRFVREVFVRAARRGRRRSPRGAAHPPRSPATRPRRPDPQAPKRRVR